MEKKISVIIPVYGTEKYLEKCIASVLNQSYKNIEIIIVNDCSPDNAQSMIDAYLEKSPQIKCVKLDQNRGLFHARLAGFDVATGDYIAFLDSDDYLAEDAYRAMIQQAESTQSDIVFGNIVIEWEADGRQETHVYNEPLWERLEGSQILETYLDQEGYTFFWYAVWNKIFSKEIFDKARPYFDRITAHTIMAEDVAFCSVLLAMADRISRIDYYTNYYLQSQTSSTSRGANQAKYMKNVEDMCRVMDFVEEFVMEYPGYEGCKDKFARFKEVFVLYWKTSISRAMFSQRKKKECLDLLKKHAKITEFPDHGRAGERSLTYGVDRSFIYNQLASFNEGYEQIIKQISCKANHTILFPFEEILFQKNIMDKKDLFWFLERPYKALCPEGRFKDVMRLRKSFEDTDASVTIDEIYRKMHSFGVDLTLCEKLKDEEIRLFKRLYLRRESVKQLFDLAVYLGKRVIVMVDNELNETVVKEMLHESGYDGYQEICFDDATTCISDTEQVVSLISSNYEAKVKAEDHEIQLAYPKAISTLLNKCEMFEYFRKSDRSEKAFFGNLLNKASLVNAANIYFDNPFRPFDQKTDFNRDAYLMGVLPIAMFSLNLTRWIMAEDQYDEILFDKSGRLMMDVARRYLDLMNPSKTVREAWAPGTKAEGAGRRACFGIKNNLNSETMGYGKLNVYGDAGEKTKHSNSLYLFLDKSLPVVAQYLLGASDDGSQAFYSERLINFHIKKGVQDFTDRMILVHGDDLMELQHDHQSMAYPFEYLLCSPKFKDIGVFDYCSIYFEKNRETEEMSLFNYWMQVNVSMADLISGKVEVGRGTGYYPFLQNRPALMKALFFLLFDNETLFEKLKIRFGANRRAYRIVDFIEKSTGKRKDKIGEPKDGEYLDEM